SSTEATSCRVALVLDTLPAPCSFVRDAFYDTLVSFSGPTDVPATLSRAGIDHVSVHEQRLLGIYRTAIFNVTTDSESLSQANGIVIDCWEGPTASRSRTESPKDIIEEFADVFHD
uniref:hypothetical protein n=1 Tax=Halorubrum amylolyticum TaxID=2508724 RepID=UPI0019D6ED84